MIAFYWTQLFAAVGASLVVKWSQVVFNLLFLGLSGGGSLRFSMWMVVGRLATCIGANAVPYSVHGYTTAGNLVCVLIAG